MRHIMLTALMIAALFGVAKAQDVKVEPAAIVETRVSELIESEDLFISSPRLHVSLRVSGEAIANASSYGKVEVEHAVDDTDQNLKPDSNGMMMIGGDDFQQIRDRAAMMGEPQPDDRKSLIAEIELAPAARDAKSIRQLKGTLQVRAGGEKKTVTVESLKSQIGKTLEEEALKQVGLTVQVLAGEMGDQSLRLSITGDSAAIQDTRIVNQAGEDIAMGHFSTTVNDKTTQEYHLSEALSDTQQLELDLVIGQKVVTVPFDLQDVKLP